MSRGVAVVVVRPPATLRVPRLQPHVRPACNPMCAQPATLCVYMCRPGEHERLHGNEQQRGAYAAAAAAGMCIAVAFMAAKVLPLPLPLTLPLTVAFMAAKVRALTHTHMHTHTHAHRLQGLAPLRASPSMASSPPPSTRRCGSIGRSPRGPAWGCGEGRLDRTMAGRRSVTIRRCDGLCSGIQCGTFGDG